MNKEQFEQEVRKLVNNEEKWMHVLPAVPEHLRNRFMDVLKAGVDIPRAYDLVLLTTDLTDETFSKKLNEIMGKDSS